MKQTILTLLLLLLLVGCGNESLQAPLPESVAVETTAIAQPVEYGASLDEWSDAVETEPTAIPTIAPLPVLGLSNPSDADESAESPTNSILSVGDDPYLELMWESLVPADFSAEAIMDKYGDQFAELEDGSPEANELYEQMQAEFADAPVNEELDGTLVKLPGFIAPLEYDGDLITEFLLVPYFGACIHVPPPPVNQTVLVEAAEGHGIKTTDSYAPIWIKGKLTTERASTELADSGYYMQDALIELYER